MDDEASVMAGNYVAYFLPGLYMAGMLDIDRNVLSSFGKSDVAMKCQIMSPFLQILFSYSLTLYYGFGIKGCAFSGTLTNTLTFLY